jgi:hypothetical protein
MVLTSTLLTLLQVIKATINGSTATSAVTVVR